MHDNLFAIGSVEHTDWRHPRATWTQAVARVRAIHMAGVQAKRAMVAMFAPRGERADEPAAMRAFEDLFAGIVPGFTRHRLGNVEFIIVEAAARGAARNRCTNQGGPSAFC